MLPHRARAHLLLLLLLACASTGVLAVTQTASRVAPSAAAAAAAAAKHGGHWGWWGGHWGGQQVPSRPTPPPTNLDDPEGKACLWTPGVLEYSNAPPNVTRVLQEPDAYFKQGGCAAAVLKDYPREVAACRACHAATTRSDCLALQADKVLNALSMTCMWRGPQPRANTRHHSQPKTKTLEARWSVGINDPSGFIYRLADDTCFVTADLEADAQSAALFQARLDWILLGPARTPEGNTPAGLNNEALCTIYGNKRKCSLTVPRAGWSKMIWMTNMITTKNPAVIANLATISGKCYDAPYYEQNCATAYSFKYTMRLTEHPCKRGTSPRFAAVSHGSLLMHNYATTLQPGKERLNGDVVPIAWLPLLAGKAARWSLSWGRNPALSSVVALVNTTDIFSKVCAQDSKLPDLFNCNMNNLKPLTIGGRWCTKRTCADQILSMPQLNDYAIVFSPYTRFVWNFTDWRFAYNPSQTPPAEVTYNEIKVWG